MTSRLLRQPQSEFRGAKSQTSLANRSSSSRLAGRQLLATASLAVEGNEAAEAPGAGVLALALDAQRQAQDPALALHVGGHHGPAAARALPGRLVRAHHPLLLRAAQRPHRVHRHCFSSASWNVYGIDQAELETGSDDEGAVGVGLERCLRTFGGEPGLTIHGALMERLHNATSSKPDRTLLHPD